MEVLDLLSKAIRHVPTRYPENVYTVKNIFYILINIPGFYCYNRGDMPAT